MLGASGDEDRAGEGTSGGEHEHEILDRHDNYDSVFGIVQAAEARHVTI